MRRALAGLALMAVLLAGGVGPALAYHDGDGGGRGDRYGNDDGGRYGNDNDNRRCRGNNCRGSFSPGPFDRSPVDVHDNCVSLDCSGAGGQKKQPPPQDQQPRSLACLVPVPWHCDEKPSSLTDPRKLPTVIAQIAKSGLDMGQLFATTTIKFVEDLFTALA